MAAPLVELRGIFKSFHEGERERDRTLFRRNDIGFVFQYYNLIPTLTVEENVLLPLELTGQLTQELRGSARYLLEQVGKNRPGDHPKTGGSGTGCRISLLGRGGGRAGGGRLYGRLGISGNDRVLEMK